MTNIRPLSLIETPNKQTKEAFKIIVVDLYFIVPIEIDAQLNISIDSFNEYC
jgi:hypothetical protein